MGLPPTGSVHDCNIINNGRYAIYADASNYPAITIDATNNWWGMTDSVAIENLIYHNPDNFRYPLVLYIPCAKEEVDIEDTTVVDVPDNSEDSRPSGFTLQQNYPNPFNSSTIIEFSLPGAAESRMVIYDVLGRRVRELFTGKLPAGSHRIEFDSRDNNNNYLPSGVYFYQLTSGEFVLSKKAVILR